MVSNRLLTMASRRTGAQVSLIKAPVENVARRHREGQSDAEITLSLKRDLGADNPAAARNFVEFVATAVDRGEA